MVVTSAREASVQCGGVVEAEFQFRALLDAAELEQWPDLVCEVFSIICVPRH